MQLSSILVAAIPLAWLVPNHYLPWPSAWQDGAALALLFGAAALANKRAELPATWVVIAAVVMLSVGLQWATGRVLFGGDALMVLLYVGAFLLSIVVGSTLTLPGGATRASGLELAAVMTAVAAIASVGIALVQWTGSVSLGIWGADLPPAGRPFANVAQPNHFSTIAYLGLCAVFLLRETGRLGETGLWFATVFLLCGMTLSGSRTGWLQIAALLAIALLYRRSCPSRVRTPHLVAVAVIYTVATLALPALNEASLLSSGRGVAHQIEGGARLPLWLSLLDAVLREPWWGYGWQQVATAQQAVALDHPPLHRHFEHSHNMPLDLLLWAGIPVGASIIALCALAAVAQLRALRDARALWLCAAVIGLGLHAQLELPLEYAYFLLPLGLALGAANALCKAGPQLSVGPWFVRGAGLVGGAFLLAIALEYLQAEQSHRLLRLETARIGTSKVESPPPDLLLLTQLEALLTFARTEARPAMQASEIARMGAVAQRYPFPPVMFRQALIEGLNGQPVEAEQTLRRLCSVHVRERCDEARESWAVLQSRYPVLLVVQPP